jgi:TetR/AcrR family transcriptional repressor of nem operon
VTLAGMVGALTLARAADDPALSKEILAAARDAFGVAQAR